MKPEVGRTLLLCLLLLRHLQHAQGANISTASYVQDKASKGLVFKDHLLWNLQLKTGLQCSELCARHAHCAAFTVTQVSSDGVTCRGHSEEMTTSGGVSRQGSRYYRLQKDEESSSPGSHFLGSAWLTKTCSTDAECNQAYTECFADQCLCTPGYFFSVGQDSCLASCANLQRDFVMYPQWYISLNNMDEASMTLTECRQWCTSFPDCVTIEFNFETSRCYISRVTAQSVGSAWQSARVNLSYWQRTCA